MKIDEYLKPKTLEEAYNLLNSCKKSAVIGGGAFLRLSNRHIRLGIDLSNIGLNYIKENDKEIEIGAMVTLREVEQSEIIKNNFDGLVHTAVKKIMGVQVRNIATVGGSVYGKYGFSDFITALLPLDCNVVLYKGGLLSLTDFLKNKDKDIIEKIVLKKFKIKAAFKDFRNTSTDFAILNTAVVMNENTLRISVGARPGAAVLKVFDQGFINSFKDTVDIAEETSLVMVKDLQFGSDIRATSEYRREICKVLVKRGVMEVVGCR
ncbi:molybdopterin dehydrogenase [Clostridium polyendosporum]|uniref:Molybdopterin dehydrogenase n=1 Tax=Clostridium polyendosporum TaxID=69208 RepID=A0A919S0Z1_9CLOT|nr:FAD binding domain-containing protein [Clostridium polyendosporum]GIM29263.1 molybdopterin dehydrogenase [Clostridium polyendosporum]